MWYNRGHENTHFYPTTDRGRTTAAPQRIAFVRCLCLATLPDFAGIGSRGTSPGDSQTAGLRRPDGAQCDQRLHDDRVGRAARRLVTSPPPAHHLHRRSMPTITGPLA